jgi:hypothetical protein
MQVYSFLLCVCFFMKPLLQVSTFPAQQWELHKNRQRTEQSTDLITRWQCGWTNPLVISAMSYSHVCCLWHAAQNLNVSHRPQHNRNEAYRWQSPTICDRDRMPKIIWYHTVSTLRASASQLPSCCFMEAAEFCQRGTTGTAQLHKLICQCGSEFVSSCLRERCSTRNYFTKSVTELSGLQKN